MPRHVTLRPETDADLSFLESLYAETRRDELAQVQWTDAEKAAFLHEQFTRQRSYYRTHYAGASFDVIEVDGVPAGRLYVLRTADDIRIVDMTLEPAFRGGGIGSTLFRHIMEEGRTTATPVTLHVEANNRAMGLFQRLGFVAVDSAGVYFLMVWYPPADPISGAP